MIEAGEATGNLTLILAKIIAHLEEKERFSKVVGSMTYPVFVGRSQLGSFVFYFSFASNSGYVGFLGRVKFDG